ncbi:MAG: hypothetical protein LBN32_00055 [Helicobacteraceae bacterium]|jgi:hypothetical protein|nr:hypothetical protein [Helicobacteraceae bacterium]
MRCLCVIALLPALLVAANEISPSLSYGIEERDFHWQISGVGGTPNVLSELDWHDMRSQRLNLGIEASIDQFNAELLSSFYVVEKGKVRDSDYEQNNKRDEYSRSYGDSSSSEFMNFAAFVGWRLPLSESLELLPQIGYRYARDKYKYNDGRQMIPYIKPIEGADSSYRYETHSIGSRAKLLFAPSALIDRVAITGGFFWCDYKADAYWNLRDLHFTQTVTGYEGELGLEALWRLSDAFSFFAQYEYRVISAENGTDRTRQPNGRTSSQPLKEVSMSSRSLLIGLRGNF